MAFWAQMISPAGKTQSPQNPLSPHLGERERYPSSYPSDEMEPLGRAWDALFEAGESAEGRAAIREAFSICPGEKLDAPADVDALAQWLYSAFDFMVPH